MTKSSLAIMVAALMLTEATVASAQRFHGAARTRTSVRAGGGAYGRGASVTRTRTYAGGRTYGGAYGGRAYYGGGRGYYGGYRGGAYVHRDVDVYGYRGGYYNRWGYPAGAAAAGAVAGLAIGTAVAALPTSGCDSIVYGGVAYTRCGSTYYQPVYRGTAVQYVVVAPPY
ncbi:MAG TPA: hypothetical protein VM734_08235 [Kofleriaceae bacterium]|nr:hypothetical protein [Kofleriaceae bacterium]